MSIQEITSHYKAYSVWLTSLKNLENEIWLKPLEEGKWTIAAIISHLLYWDQYSLNERFPYFKEGAKLDRFPDFQLVNDKADAYSKNVCKEQLIDELLSIRERFIAMVSEMNEEELKISFQIGEHKLTIQAYFKDFIEHDLHHKEQVIQKIKSISSK